MICLHVESVPNRGYHCFAKYEYECEYVNSSSMHDTAETVNNLN